MGFIEHTTGQWRCERCGTRTKPETKQRNEFTKPDGWEFVPVHDVGMFGMTEHRLMCTECVKCVKKENQ